MCSSEGNNQELYLEWKRRAGTRQGQMGHTSAPNLPRRVGDHRPQNPIGGLVGQVADQRPNPGRGTLEGADQEGCRPDQTPSAWEKAKHPRHQLVIRRPQTKKDSALNIVGSWLNMRPGLTKADPTSAAETLRQPLFGNPSIPQLKRHPVGPRRPEGRKCLRKSRLHES